MSYQFSPRKQERPKPSRDMLTRDDFIYPMGKEKNDIEALYTGVLEPLQLYAPYTHEVGPMPKEVVLERPITPINDEIKSAPNQLERLARYVRRRLSPNPEVKHLAVDDQKELAAIILGEVNDVWSDIKQQVDHPFFSNEQNGELQRRIAVHVVTVCEQLFKHYINKAETLQKRGVFSGPANMSRLKAQLALDTNKFLNILTIRRYIIEDLQRPPSSDEEEYIPREPEAVTARKNKQLSYKKFLEASRPKSRSHKHYYIPPDQAIEEMRVNMPDLDTKKLMSVLQEMTLEPHTPEPYSELSSENIRQSSETSKMSSAFGFDSAMGSPRLKRPASAPRLHAGENLLDELGIEESEIRRLQKHAMPATMDHIAHNIKSLESQTASQSDLEKLMAREKRGQEAGAGAIAEEDDMPPLLQALSRSPKHDNAQEAINRKLEELEEREKKRAMEEIVYISEPRYPQPATIDAKLPNKIGMAKTADVRVSERLCMWSMTLKKNATVYNDLLDEIDPATVKQLDNNLFLGDEITEVYKEIMKTVPTDHLDLENDPLVEDAATEAVDLKQALASGTLERPRRQDRVINPRLADPQSHSPWGTQDRSAWEKTPADPPLDIRGRPLIQQMAALGEDRGLKDFLGKEAPKYVDDTKNNTKLREMGEVMARTYNSWLSYWKSTINGDDYYKYLSKQGTDYMGAIFHFYNSDVEDDDDDQATSRLSKKTLKLMEERNQLKEKLKAVKSTYSDGFWNPNTVLMGGLGQEPDVDEELTSASMAGKSDTTDRTQGKGRKIIKRSKTDSDSKAGISTKGQSTTRRPSESNSKSKQAKGEDDPDKPTFQDRLERVWMQLQFPDNLKLDMAIKYSSDTYHRQLEYAISLWEKATDLILKREQQLAKLETFERLASDPNRFFEKGPRGSSGARLHEAKLRNTITKKMKTIDKELRKVLKHIKQEFDDVVTFQGRGYDQKMSGDKTEMLYWLQEERKQQAIEYELSQKQQQGLKSTRSSELVLTGPIFN